MHKADRAFNLISTAATDANSFLIEKSRRSGSNIYFGMKTKNHCKCQCMSNFNENWALKIIINHFFLLDEKVLDTTFYLCLAVASSSSNINRKSYKRIYNDNGNCSNALKTCDPGNKTEYVHIHHSTFDWQKNVIIGYIGMFEKEMARANGYCCNAFQKVFNTNVQL